MPPYDFSTIAGMYKASPGHQYQGFSNEHLSLQDPVPSSGYSYCGCPACDFSSSYSQYIQAEAHDFIYNYFKKAGTSSSSADVSLVMHLLVEFASKMVRSRNEHLHLQFKEIQKSYHSLLMQKTVSNMPKNDNYSVPNTVGRRFLEVDNV